MRVRVRVRARVRVTVRVGVRVRVVAHRWLTPSVAAAAVARTAEDQDAR